MRIQQQPNKPNPGLPKKLYKDTTIEQKGDLFRIVRKLPADMTLQGLDKLVAEGAIQSYSREGDQFVIYAGSANAMDTVASLPQNRLPHPWVEKAKEILLPPNMDENCSKDYLRFRSWSLGSSVCGSAISFSSLAVTMDATHIALGTTEKIVMAQTINTYAWRFTSMGASFLGQKGDKDPRRYYTVNNLVAVSNSLLCLGLLSVIPKSYVPLALGTSITGAFASSLGGAANVNVFNHMAKNNKGLVSSKNSVQELCASLLGTPISMGIKWAAHKVGVPPALATAGVLGPIQLFCAMQAAKSIHMEPIQRGHLEQLSDNYLQTGEFKDAPEPTMLGNIKAAIVGEATVPCSDTVQVVNKVDDLLQNNANPQDVFSTFRSDKYLVNFDPAGKTSMALRRDAGLEDVFRAYTQARYLELARPKLYDAVKDLVGDKDAPNALVELAHRGLGQPTGAWQGLAEAGWHTNTLTLEMKTVEGEWKGDAKNPLPPTDRAELMSLAANPDKKRLAQLLGKSNAA